jgi:hypothetical protein
MTPHLLPHSTSRRGYSRFTILCSLRGGILRTLAVAAGLGGIVGVASADPPIPTLPVRPAGVSDAIVARGVHLAIDADPELCRLNLLVSVVDGVAVIGGPVSSAAVAKHAEEVVRRVPDIKDVRNGCFVKTGPDPLMRAVAERLGSPPARQATTELPGVLTGPQPPVWGSPTPAGFQNPNLVAAAQQGKSGNTVVVLKPALPGGDGIGVLGAPVGTSGLGSESASGGGRDSSTAPGKLTGTGSVVPSQASVSDILTSAGNVKKVEARFTKLTVEMRDGIIVIGGSAPRASDAWDLAEKLRQIPGVARVVIATTPGKP